MMMIRPNNGQKMGGKPPPPVPPRPSKSVVADALAKSRQNNFKSPIRQAPPPPVTGANEIVKSKSSYAVNVSLKKPPVYDRSISEEFKNTSRPVVYQSSNVKCFNGVSSVENKVQVINNETDDSKFVKRIESFSKVSNGSIKSTEIARRNSTKCDSALEEKLRKRDSFCAEQSPKRDSLCGEKFVEKIVNIEDKCTDKLIQNDENFENSKSNSSTLEKSCDSSTTSSSSSSEKKNWDQMLNDRNHVNTLIDEMFASVLEVQVNDEENSSESSENSVNDTTKIIIGPSIEEDPEVEKIIRETDNVIVINNNENDVGAVPTTVIVIKSDNTDVESRRESDESRCNSAERSRQVKFKDQLNHELLIDELQCMKKDQEKIMKRQRKPSMNLYEDEDTTHANHDKIRRPDTLDLDEHKRDRDRLLNNMSSLQHGLPPLPKSLSGFNLTSSNHPPTPPRSTSIRTGTPPTHVSYSPHSGKPTPELPGNSMKKTTGLDAKLAILRQEMYSLRQLDLSLLSQLWSLNESIQDFRQMLQEQEERVLSPPSPSPTPSSGDEEFYVSATSLNFRPTTTSSMRKQSTSSNASSMGG